MSGIRTDDTEAFLHSLFANTTGFAFTLFAVSLAFISATTRDRILALLAAVLATGLSLAMAAFPDGMGIFQRVIFLFAFAWFLYVAAPAYRLK